MCMHSINITETACVAAIFTILFDVLLLIYVQVSERGIIEKCVTRLTQQNYISPTKLH